MNPSIKVVAVLVAVGTLVLARGIASDPPYSVRVELENAGGLREGSTVRVGGVPVGQVVSLRLGEDDLAVAELELDDSDAAIGEGAAAGVRSANLLGQKFVALDQGDVTRPLGSGAVIPRDRTSVSVDLDQLLGVFDVDTRARLAILINEAGLALTGRRADFNAMLERLPPSLEATTRMLDELAADNRALGRVVERGDRFLRRISADRRDLGELVAAAGGAMQTLSTKRAELDRTLQHAPDALRSLQSFLAEVQSTAEPLGPAARALTSSAPSLTDTLSAVPSFEGAARPLFDEAGSVAPSLSRLGREATPVVREAEPTLRALAGWSGAMRPFSRTLDASVDDAFGAVEGWARAVQERDGLGHYFRYKTVLDETNLKKLVDLVQGDTRARRKRPTRRTRPGRPGSTAGRPRPKPDGNPLKDLPGDLDSLLEEVAPDVGAPDVGKVPDERLTGLLDFLLAP